MTRIVGIDPGSRITGYGVVDFDGGQATHVASGCIRVADGDLAARLLEIHEAVRAVVDRHRPGEPGQDYEMAVEQVFMHRNAVSALKLGQARGVALLAGVQAAMPVHEYAPNLVKQAVTGHGHAEKEQVQHMVRVLLKLEAVPQSDAADALAVALCHGHLRAGLARLESAGAGNVRGTRRASRRWRQLPAPGRGPVT